MDENIRESKKTVYEVGYLIAGVPDEKVANEADSIKAIAVAAGAEVIAEEAPRKEKLAYTIRKKTVAGSYDKFDTAHFGWVKFEAGSEKIEGIKKAVELLPSVLRMLVIITVRENTYLGKHAPAIAETFAKRPFMSATADATAASSPARKEAPVAPIAAASAAEMDKSIDDMVKEA